MRREVIRPDGQKDIYVTDPGEMPQVTIPENHFHLVAQTELLRVGIRNRNQNMADRASMAADKTVMSGQSRINGAGEVLLTIPFSCKFSEKPLFYFGGEIVETKEVRPGNFPTISAFVCGWSAEEGSDNDLYPAELQDPNVAPTSRFFTGATIGVVISGDPHGKFVLHWHFIGDAINGPDGSY